MSDKSCSLLQCGNGNLNINETCDDNNTILNDGCTNNCTLEIGFNCKNELDILPSNCLACFENCAKCTGIEREDCIDCKEGYLMYSNKSCIVMICGNGVRTLDEQCDDGNLNDNDGCNSKCEWEPNFFCRGIDT